MKKFYSLLFVMCISYVMVAQNNYLTVAELMTEYNNLHLASGKTASGTYTVRGYVTVKILSATAATLIGEEVK